MANWIAKDVVNADRLMNKLRQELAELRSMIQQLQMIKSRALMFQTRSRESRNSAGFGGPRRKADEGARMKSMRLPAAIGSVLEEVYRKGRFTQHDILGAVYSRFPGMRFAKSCFYRALRNLISTGQIRVVQRRHGPQPAIYERGSASHASSEVPGRVV